MPSHRHLSDPCGDNVGDYFVAPMANRLLVRSILCVVGRSIKQVVDGRLFALKLASLGMIIIMSLNNVYE